MYDSQANATVSLTTQDAKLTLGGGGVGGVVAVAHTDGTSAVELLALPNESVIGAGQTGHAGRLTMYNDQGKQTLNLKAQDATLDLGGSGLTGSVWITGSDGRPLIGLHGGDTECAIDMGQTDRPGRISVNNADGATAVMIDGKAGDIWLANADCAEEFDLAVLDIEPGTVVVLTDGGGLAPSSTAYDARVAGVVSGAGAYRPGLVLDRRSTGTKRAAVALLGKVYCRVEASRVPVRVGDLLTTSDREGHAMRATDPQRAFGAVLGKALAPLSSGSGIIPILVALQ
jgi:hypothetical protein